MMDDGDFTFASETVRGTVAKFTLALIGFIGSIVFAHILGPAKFGGYYMLIALVELADRPIAGWARASKKRFSEANAPQNRILGAQLFIDAVWLLPVAIASIIASDVLSETTGINNAPSLFFVLIAARTLYLPLDQMLQARGKISLAFWIDTLRSLFTFPFQLLLVLVGFGGAGMAYGLTGATVLTLPILWHFLETVPAIPSYQLIRNIWSYARYSIPDRFLGSAYNRFDILLLGILVGPTASGHYEAAAKLTLAGTFISEVSSSGLLTRVSYKSSKGESPANDVSNTLAFSSILSIPILFGSLALAKPLMVTFYGREFSQAAPLLIGLAAYRVVHTLNYPLLQTTHGLDLPEVNLRLSVFTLLINLLLGVVLVFEFGAIGAVVATVIAELVRYFGIMIVIVRKLEGVSVLPPTLIKQFIAGGVMFAVVSLANQSTTVTSWRLLLAVVFLGAFAYSVTLISISKHLRTTVIGVASAMKG